MESVGLGPFPISSYGTQDRDSRLYAASYSTYRGGYELGIGGERMGTSPTNIQGRDTRPVLADTHEGYAARKSDYAQDGYTGFTWKCRFDGV